MMRKGVSPVVATVLLIAIAVISAVAVWYWVAPLTSAQATPSTSQYGFVITSTYKNSTTGNCTTVDLKNSGGISIPINTAFEARWLNGTSSGKYVNVTTALTSGSTSNYNIANTLLGAAGTGIQVGSYFLRVVGGSSGVTGFTDVYFTC